jgi:hypothetical protein
MCPRNCGVDLAMAERQGIAIDYCPKCRGIWLDHGELEKFMELAEGRMNSLQGLMPPPGSRPDPGYDLEREARMRKDRYNDDDYDDDDRHRYGKRKRKGMWDVFDIFD